LIDNYSKEPTIKPSENDEIENVKIYDLKERKKDPKKVEVTHLSDLMFQASGERLEQIVRMTDFDNREAVLRVYDVLDKL